MKTKLFSVIVVYIYHFVQTLVTGVNDLSLLLFGRYIDCSSWW